MNKGSGMQCRDDSLRAVNDAVTHHVVVDVERQVGQYDGAI